MDSPGLYVSNATLTVFTKGEVAERARAGTLADLSFDEWREKTFAARADPACMPTFEQRCHAAREASFLGFSVNLSGYNADAAQRKRDVTELRTSGLKVNTIENSLNAWHAAPDGEAFANWQPAEESMYGLADLFGAKRLLVLTGPFVGSVPFKACVERFAQLCGRAAERGLDVGLEFVAGTQIATANDAWRLVEEAGCPNSGLIVDSFSFFRGGSTFEMLRSVPPERIYSVQLCDGGIASDLPPFQEALRHRFRPGEGVMDLAGLIRTLDGMGVDADYEVEVFADAYRGLPVEEAAQKAYDATMAVLEEARGR